MAFISTIGEGFQKIFRVDLGRPGTRFAITTGESNENDPVYSPDGQRIYFTSDRNGPENIFSLDLAKGELRQYTNVVTGAFMPTVLREPEGERLVYTGFWKGSFDLYVTNTDEPVTEPQTVQIPAEPAGEADLPGFEPDIQVTIDDANKDKYGGYKLFLEDAQTIIGVNSDQSYLGQIIFTFSDYLGDRRIFANISSVDSLSNFDIVYADYSRRWFWYGRVFDSRSFYTADDSLSIDRGVRGRLEYQVTGAIGAISYPFTFYQRAELGLGYLYRKYNYPVEFFDPFTGQFGVEYLPFEDDFPVLQGALVGDSATYANYGPVNGRLWRLDLSYAPDLEDSGTLFTGAELELRQYIQVTQRSNFAFRAFAGISEGNQPSIYFFGGLDTIRGIDFRSIEGDHSFFLNLEYRFPLIDLVATPILAFQGVRGVIFADVGGAWYDDFEDFDFYDEDTDRFEDGIAVYGWGVTVHFLGFDLNWDFAKRFRSNDEDEDDAFETVFWIGTRF